MRIGQTKENICLKKEIGEYDGGWGRGWGRGR